MSKKIRAAKTIKVLLEPKKKMRDKKGRLWMGMNKKAAKPNSFRDIGEEEVREDLPKRIRKATERHEYIEAKEMGKGKKYKAAHRIALKREKKAVKGVRFTERKGK